MTRILAFDLETTGTDPRQDRIVELAWSSAEVPVRVDPPVKRERVDPGVPIPEEAQAVHGISDDDVSDAPPFAAIAAHVQRLVDGADVLLTYAGRSFDVPLLDAELHRAGQPGVDLGEQDEIDLYRVWQELEPRTLEGALRRFGASSERKRHDAHDAGSDTRALWPVLRGISQAYADRGRELDLEDLARLSAPEKEVDRAGKLRRREDGVVCFAFGKHQGEPVADHPEYADWLLGADFAEDTKTAVREALKEGVARV